MPPVDPTRYRPPCVDCGGTRIRLNGHRMLVNRKVPFYICNDCKRAFIDPRDRRNFPQEKDHSTDEFREWVKADDFLQEWLVENGGVMLAIALSMPISKGGGLWYGELKRKWLKEYNSNIEKIKAYLPPNEDYWRFVPPTSRTVVYYVDKNPELREDAECLNWISRVLASRDDVKLYYTDPNRYTHIWKMETYMLFRRPERMKQLRGVKWLRNESSNLTA